LYEYVHGAQDLRARYASRVPRAGQSQYTNHALVLII
jgi:hypothetical protein